MGIKTIIILIVIVSFIAVTYMGWDEYLILLEKIGIKFGEFVEGGINEAQERI